MEKKEKFNVGDLCLYYDIPVVVLEVTFRYTSINIIGTTREGKYSYLCLFNNGADHVVESSLRKI
tara:strand:- start:212 stop:406 length:195 start_codon:yes stop_codon:yes gene_type:complete